MFSTPVICNVLVGLLYLQGLGQEAAPIPLHKTHALPLYQGFGQGWSCTTWVVAGSESLLFPWRCEQIWAYGLGLVPKPVLVPSGYLRFSLGHKVFAASPPQGFSGTCLANDCGAGTKKSPLN